MELEWHGGAVGSLMSNAELGLLFLTHVLHMSAWGLGVCIFLGTRKKHLLKIKQWNE